MFLQQHLQNITKTKDKNKAKRMNIIKNSAEVGEDNKLCKIIKINNLKTTI